MAGYTTPKRLKVTYTLLLGGLILQNPGNLKTLDPRLYDGVQF